MNELITVQENTAIVERQTVGAELFDLRPYRPTPELYASSLTTSILTALTSPQERTL